MGAWLVACGWWEPEADSHAPRATSRKRVSEVRKNAA
jgi:hypothetical protein